MLRVFPLVGSLIAEGLSSKMASLSLSTAMMSTTPSPPFPTSNLLDKKLQDAHGLRIDVVKVEDTSEVLQFLRKNFFRDEPLCAAIRLLEGEHDRCKPLEDYSLKDISQGLSVKAVDDEGRIMGVVLATATYRHQSEQDIEDWSIGCDHPKFKKILHFFYQCEKACDVFSIYPDLDSQYDMKIISVDKSRRGQGVGRILSDKVFDMARKSKLGFAKLICTSDYTSQLADKFDCVENYSIRYEDWKVDGEQIFHTDPPHTTFRIKTLRLIN